MADSPKTFVNKATATFTILGKSYQIESNEVSCVALDVLPTLVKVQSEEVLAIGETINYTVTGINSTGLGILGYIFNDPLPEGLEYVDGSFKVDGVVKTPTVTNNKITYDIGAWNLGVTHIFTFQCKRVAVQVP